MPVKLPPYDIGDDLEIRGQFADSSGNLFDPTDASLELRCPDKTVLTIPLVDLTRASQGDYTYIYTVANGWGIYRGTWRAQGTPGIVQQFRFPVQKPAEEEP